MTSEWTYTDVRARLALHNDEGHEIGFVEILGVGWSGEVSVELDAFDIDCYDGGPPTPEQQRLAEQGARELLAAALAALTPPGAQGEG